MKRKSLLKRIKSGLNLKNIKVEPRVAKLAKLFLLLLIVASLIFNFKSLFLVGFVNGYPISRLSFDRLLEKQAGKQILDTQVTKLLISQEGRKQKIDIKTSEVDGKITEIEKQVETQGTNLDSLLQTQGQTRNELKEQIKLQLVIEKILGKDISIADKEIADYFEKNKASLVKDATLESTKSDIQKDLFQQKINEKFQPWLEELRKKAKIYYFLKL